MQPKSSVYGEFLSSITSVNGQCLEHSIHPELAVLKKEITGLMD
jgi:hypothetical protein